MGQAYLNPGILTKHATVHAATMADSVHIHNVTLPYALRQSVLLYAPTLRYAAVAL